MSRDRVAEDLRELVFEGIEGFAVCRDLSDLVIEVLEKELLLTESLLERERRYGFSREMEAFFGVAPQWHFQSFPPSAYHGPFYPLLKHHPEKAIPFLVRVFDHSAEWYAERKLPGRYIEPVETLPLRFADGVERQLWCNSRLWCWYRASSVGPYVLMSALMALELWLLECTENDGFDLDGMLLELLRSTKSGAVAAVVAGVATAHPHRSREALCTFLRTSEFFRLDIVRQCNEATVRMQNSMFPTRPEHEIYETERKSADNRTHRGQTLETAILNLQLGPARDDIWSLVDACLAELPPADEQAQDERLRQLSLARMDLRNFQPEPVQEDVSGEANVAAMLRLEVPDEGLRQMSDEATSGYEEMNNQLSLQMWGIAVFERSKEGGHDPDLWRERLGFVMQHAPEIETWTHGRGAPGFVAAVCVRDHWDEMDRQQREWCAGEVCRNVEDKANDWNRQSRVQRGAIEPDRPSAYVLPSLVGRELPDDLRERVARSLVLAMTHAIDEVRRYAAFGVGESLWSVGREKAIGCANVVAVATARLQHEWKSERELPFEQQRDLERLDAEVTLQLREELNSEKAELTAESLAAFDTNDWFGAEANRLILSVLLRAPSDPVSVEAFEAMASTLVEWWDRAADHRDNDWRTPDAEHDLLELLHRFLLTTSEEGTARVLEPIATALTRHPRDSARVLEGVTSTEDRLHYPERFWAIWQRFVDGLVGEIEAGSIRPERYEGKDLVRAAFLGLHWRDGVRHWRSLDGQANRIHDLFARLPKTANVIEEYARFLHTIGSGELPGAFVTLAQALAQEGGPPVTGNARYFLESVLLRWVYGRPDQLKVSAEVRDAVLSLLDRLIAEGSSSAYRMRDDFLTPASGIGR